MAQQNEISLKCDIFLASVMLQPCRDLRSCFVLGWADYGHNIVLNLIPIKNKKDCARIKLTLCSDHAQIVLNLFAIR